MSEGASIRKTSRERFTEVAPKRTQKVLEALRLLGRCGNRQIYEYDDGEVGRVFGAILTEVRLAQERFEADSEPTTFAL